MVVMLKSKEKATIEDLEDMHVVRLKMLDLQDLADSIYKRCITRYEKLTGDSIEASKLVEEMYKSVVGEFEARKKRAGKP